MAALVVMLVSAPCCTSFTFHTPSRPSSNIVLSAQRRAGRTRPPNKAGDAVQVIRQSSIVTPIRPDWEPTRQRNVHKQFTSRHITYEEERLHGTTQQQESGVTLLQSDETKLPSVAERQHLTEKIALLLKDDDDSFLAANDIADRQTVFARLSDEEKSEASFAVSKVTNRSSNLEERRKTKGKVTANVLETGQDTMKQYVKSMGQHQVLSPEDESVLGRQIQILNKWEQKRQRLEETLLR